MRTLRVALVAGGVAAAATGCAQVDVPVGGPTVFGNGSVAGHLQGGDMREVSGMVASLAHPGHFWLHNDSGAEPELILIDSTGVEKARVLVQGASNRDWEDISRRGDTLLVAETGDNNAKHDTIFVYAVLEPKTIANEPVAALAVYPMQFPDGPRDSESLMVDHATGDWYLVSKREDNVRVYRYAAPQRARSLVTLERLPLELPFRMAVAADMTADGREFVIKTYDSIYLWRRAEGETMLAALRRAPAKQPYTPERQGEAIAYTLNGSQYFTASEIEVDDPQLLIRYPRRPVEKR
jgi:hypothetical protein